MAMNAKISARTAGLTALTAACICLLVFSRALWCDFVNIDDGLYIIDNPGIRILDREFLSWAFTTSYMGWWMPLTWISFAIDYLFWGLNPFGFHLTNILFHAANTGMVVLLADRFLRGENSLVPDRSEESSTRNGSSLIPSLQYPGILLLAGLLWGIHPLRVESVAWVTERKDVLNGFFSLATLLLYLQYVQRRDRGASGSALITPFFCSLCTLFLSLAAKPVSVVIPVMLLVLDWFPLKRLKPGNIKVCISEKIPYLVLSAGVAFTTIYLARGESIMTSYADFPLGMRLILAGNAILEYLKMTVYPAGIVNLYLLPRDFPPSYYVTAAVSFLIIIACLVTWRKRPWYLATMMLFLLPLIPVLGFFQNGAQAYAARFTYLPGITVSVAAACAIGLFTGRLKGGRRAGMILVLLAAMLLLAVQSFHLIGSWESSESLWTRLIEIRPAGRAFYLRAEHRNRNGNYQGAAEDLAVSLEMGKSVGYPGVHKLHAMRGDVFMKLGRFEDAVTEFTAAINLNPQQNYFYHRGRALRALGRTDRAELDFAMAGEAKEAVAW